MIKTNYQRNSTTRSSVDFKRPFKTLPRFNSISNAAQKVYDKVMSDREACYIHFEQSKKKVFVILFIP